MKMAHPVLTGGTTGLRDGIEAFLSTNPEAVDRRIEELDARAAELGRVVTFGAEVEFAFVSPSQLAGPASLDNMYLYQSVAHNVNGRYSSFDRSYNKGEVAHPNEVSGGIMGHSSYLGSYNSDSGQSQAGIIEHRTTPARAIEAADRYWRLVEAIGRTAESNNLLGIIVGTHFNVVAWQNYHDVEFAAPLDYRYELGREFLGSFQRNLQSIEPFQYSSGLDRGYLVQEAFPDKNASTATHIERLEVRHPTVGLIDPRVDILAALSAAIDSGDSGSNKAARAVARLYFPNQPSSLKMGNLLSVVATHCRLDVASGELVLPSRIGGESIGGSNLDSLDRAIEYASDNRYLSGLDQNAKALRGLIHSVRLDGSRLTTEPSEYLLGVPARRMNGSKVELLIAPGRTAPRVVVDAPEVHFARRRQWKASSSLRSIFGSAGESITAAESAVRTRQEIMDHHMLVS